MFQKRKVYDQNANISKNYIWCVNQNCKGRRKVKKRKNTFCTQTKFKPKYCYFSHSNMCTCVVNVRVHYIYIYAGAIPSNNIDGCLLRSNHSEYICFMFVKNAILIRSSTHFTNETNNLKYIPKMLENIIYHRIAFSIKYRKK